MVFLTVVLVMMLKSSIDLTYSMPCFCFPDFDSEASKLIDQPVVEVKQEA